MAKVDLNIPCEVLVFGGSAGSLEVLLKILVKLKSPLAFAILIVMHRKNSHDSTLIELMASKTSIPVKEVEDKDPLEAGSIYVAPADYHLLIEDKHTFSLDASEKVNFSRPSIDVTFESVAEIFGKSAIAVLLSGANSDGTAGLAAIKQNGGTTVTQDPTTAQVPFMPQHAMQEIPIDYVLNPEEMPEFINSL